MVSPVVYTSWDPVLGFHNCWVGLGVGLGVGLFCALGLLWGLGLGFVGGLVFGSGWPEGMGGGGAFLLALVNTLEVFLGGLEGGEEI